jgi:hypothetical protein
MRAKYVGHYAKASVSSLTNAILAGLVSTAMVLGLGLCACGPQDAVSTGDGGAGGSSMGGSGGTAARFLLW